MGGEREKKNVTERQVLPLKMEFKEKALQEKFELLSQEFSCSHIFFSGLTRSRP